MIKGRVLLTLSLIDLLLSQHRHLHQNSIEHIYHYVFSLVRHQGLRRIVNINLKKIGFKIVTSQYSIDIKKFSSFCEELLLCLTANY